MLTAAVVAELRTSASAEAEAGCTQPFGLYGITKDALVAIANLARVVAVPAVTPQREAIAAVGAFTIADNSNGAIATPEATSVNKALEPEVASVP